MIGYGYVLIQTWQSKAHCGILVNLWLFWGTQFLHKPTQPQSCVHDRSDQLVLTHWKSDIKWPFWLYGSLVPDLLGYANLIIGWLRTYTDWNETSHSQVYTEYVVLYKRLHQSETPEPLPKELPFLLELPLYWKNVCENPHSPGFREHWWLWLGNYHNPQNMDGLWTMENPI